jgi:hypothetical protein
MTPDDQHFEMSAADVVEHMLVRAKLYPAVHLFVLTFPIAGLTFMLRNAESAGDTEAYLGCLRILNQVCASSHMTGYVFNITEFFVDWFCMSDAEREITGRALLFRKTSNGATIYSDSMKRRSQDASSWEEASDTDHVMTPDGKKSVNPETFFYLSTGAERAERYFNVYPKNGIRTDTLRSEKESEGGVSLSLVAPLLSTLNETAKNEVDKFVSTSAEFLKTRLIITTKELKSDLTFLNEQLPTDDRVKPSKNDKGNIDKNCLIEAVISARQKLIERDASWIVTRKSQLHIAPIQDEQETSLHDRRESALDSISFNFVGTASRQKYEAKKHKFQGTMPVDAGTSSDTEGGGGNDNEVVELVALRVSESSTMTGVETVVVQH